MATYAIQTRGVNNTPSALSSARTAAHTTRSLWATGFAYAIVYGVAFAFLMGPASTFLVQSGHITAARSAHFTMIVIAALMVGVAAPALAVGLGSRVDSATSPSGRGPSSADAVFGTWAVLVSVAVAGMYVALATVTMGGYSSGIGWAAVVGVLVPGVLAGVTARTCGPQMARKARDFAGGAVGAMTVVGLAVYLCMTIAAGEANIAVIAGSPVLP